MTDTTSLDGRTVVVTGGAGFIGSHIADRLVGNNEVRVVDDLSTGDRGNVPAGAEFVRKSITELETEDFAGADVVFHEAANVAVQRSVEDPEFDARSNVLGLIRVLEAAVGAGVDRVVTASSSAVYGTPESLPVEETQPTNPESPYAASKLAGEGYCRTYRNLHDLETVCLRYFNVYGPRQRGDSPYSGVIAIFARRAVEGQPLVIHGDGEQTRDFVHVSDVVAANVAAATIDDPAHLVYNVGTGESTSVADVADTVAASVDREVDRRHESRRPGDVDHSRADTSRMVDDLGVAPTVSLREGVADVVEHKR